MKKKQILIVEDERIVADDIKMSLERLGYVVSSIAFSGKEATKKAEELHPDLVLMDIVLKGEMTGIETAGIIHSRFDIPVVYLSAYADDKTLERAKITEPFGYILKPFEDRDLHSTIEMALYKHKMENRLKESEERHRSVVENAHDVIYIITPNGLQYVNPAFEKLAGFKKNELCNPEFNFWSIIHPDDLKLMKEREKAKKKGVKETASFEFRIISKDGGMKTVEANIVNIGKNGEVKEIGILRDITDRKQAEEEIRKLSSAVEQSIDGITIVDLDLKLTYVNNAFARMHGYSPKEMIGMKLKNLHNREQMEQFNKRITQIKKQGSWMGEIGYIRKDGTPFPAYISATLLKDVNGKSPGILAVARDITENKRVDQELKKSLKRLFTSFEETIKAISSALERRDPYTAGHQKRVTNLACAIAKEMGLSKEKINGLRMAGLIHDIGKIQVPTEILNKPGQLSDTEFNMIKMHPQVGYDILKTIEFPYPVAKIILQHHERMDGSGYPAGLSGEEILLEARILAAADVIEAMGSHRPYRPALGIGKALEAVAQNKGNLYDPEVVDACLKLFYEKGFKFE